MLEKAAVINQRLFLLLVGNIFCGSVSIGLIIRE